MGSTDQHAGAVGTANDDIDLLLLRGGHEALEGHLVVEQSVAPGIAGLMVIP